MLKPYVATADRCDGIAAGLFCVLLVIIACTFTDYGIGWDDPVQSQYGDLVLHFIRSGGTDRRAIEFQNLRFYGGLFEAPVQYAAQFLPWNTFDTRHLMTALAGALGILGAWRLARYLGGSLAALLALLFLATLPSFYGHLFINSKDIPFAAAYIWSLYFALRVIVALPRLPWRDALMLGIALGITLGIRIGGIMLLAYIGLLVPYAYFYMWYNAYKNAPQTVTTTLQTVLCTGLRSVLIIFIPAYLLMLSCWPWSILNPITAVYRALRETVQFAWDSTVLFKGAYVRSTQLPDDYWPVYLSVKLPDYLLLLFLCSLPAATLQAGQAMQRCHTRQLFGYTILTLGIFFPPLYAILKQTVHYDAIRHFLFILPPIAVLCATVAARYLKVLWQKQPALALALFSALLFGAAMPAYEMVRLHPYQYVYYNWLAGGVAGAAGRYETDYWATSYREAARKLATYIQREDETVLIPYVKRRYGVLVCGPASSLAPFLSPDLQLVEQINRTDFFLSFTRWQCHHKLEGKPIIQIKRAGALLAVVKDLRRMSRVSREP